MGLLKCSDVSLYVFGAIGGDTWMEARTLSSRGRPSKTALTFLIYAKECNHHEGLRQGAG